jgi:hypothetical protein
MPVALVASLYAPAPACAAGGTCGRASPAPGLVPPTALCQRRTTCGVRATPVSWSGTPGTANRRAARSGGGASASVGPGVVGDRSSRAFFPVAPATP